MRAEDLKVLREHMVAEISADAARVRELTGKSRLDERVMAAIAKVPRHEFVPIELQPLAYANMPLPIGCEKTISQPFIVALMTDLLDISAEDVVLEIGTGLGYQAAILGALARKVYSMEIIEELGTQAKQRLHRLGFTAAPDLIPPPLLHQLKSGGKMVLPAGLPDAQQLLLVQKDESGKVGTKEILAVRFSQLEETEPG
jgi:protein-L-isoaspartate(D-aspartate) O-methyltransferase